MKPSIRDDLVEELIDAGCYQMAEALEAKAHFGGPPWQARQSNPRTVDVIWRWNRMHLALCRAKARRVFQLDAVLMRAS